MLKQWLAFKYPVKNIHKEHIYVTSNVCDLYLHFEEDIPRGRIQKSI